MPKADPTAWMEDYGYVKWEDRNNPENGGKTESWQTFGNLLWMHLKKKIKTLLKNFIRWCSW